MKALAVTTLEPVRELLAHSSIGEHRDRDGAWAAELETEALRAKAELSVVLHEEQFSLSRIMSLQVGDTLLFERGTEDAVELRCNGIPIGLGRAGRSGRRVAFEVGACRNAAT